MKTKRKVSFVYILCNYKRNVLYTGVTNNLARRVFEHESKLVGGFTTKYCVDRLVYYESFDDIRDAIYREKMVKKKSKNGKVRLIESINQEWKDLYSSLL
jgi:putative endonuclease